MEVKVKGGRKGEGAKGREGRKGKGKERGKRKGEGKGGKCSVVIFSCYLCHCMRRRVSSQSTPQSN